MEAVDPIIFRLAIFVLAIIPLLTDKDTKAFAPQWDDEIIKGAALTRDGAVIHPALVKEAA